MNQKCIEHIILYSLVLVGTLVVGVLVRQYVLSKGVDDFSSSVAFFATVIVLMAIYASLQTTFNQFLLPRIEAFLLRFSAFQTMKNYNDTVSVPEAPTIKDSNQATTDIIESDPTAKETISEPSEYEVMRTNAIAKKNRATQTRLEKVLSYTKQTMVAYMSEEDLNRLCAYIVEYSSGDTLQKISPVKVDSQLKSIDIMHFGWNIGKAFGIKRIHTATFIKNVFAHTLCDLEISTIERKMSNNVLGKIDLSKFEKKRKEIVEGKENIYIIDTNVFVNCPNIIDRIGHKYKVIIPAKVLEELDKLKLKNNIDKNALNTAARNINLAFTKQFSKMEDADISLLPVGFDKNNPDCQILSVALKYKGENPIILTSDNILQTRAKGLGITTISLTDFLRQLR